MTPSRASTLLLVIDPQNDFCDLPPHALDTGAGTGAPLMVAPSLPVAGADADMWRLAQWLDANAAQIDSLTVTLDSHQRFDIAHPGFWRNGDGEVPAPFTPVTAADVCEGRCVPADPAHLARTLAYLDALQARGRYTHMIWPVHCELGSWGHGIHHVVLQALGRWQMRRHRAVTHVIKGTNPWTEHYSALQAEVPDPADPDTQLNTRLLQQLNDASRIIVAGEASSHCVRNTVEDLLAQLPDGFAARLTLLTDCTSPVAGFEAQHHAFLESLRQRGATLAETPALRLAD